MLQSFGMMGNCGISTSSPFDLSFRIVTSMTFDISFLTTSLVPLHNIYGLMFHKIIIGAPILRNDLCGGTQERSKHLKSLPRSINLYVKDSPGSYLWISRLIALADHCLSEVTCF